jgi:hypothetical protein
VYHEDLVVTNLHTIVVALLQEVSFLFLLCHRTGNFCPSSPRSPCHTLTINHQWPIEFRLKLSSKVKNLRSQVSRFALTTFADLFTHLKRYMDIDLDIAVKTIMQKNGESSDFIR